MSLRGSDTLRMITSVHAAMCALDIDSVPIGGAEGINITRARLVSLMKEQESFMASAALHDAKVRELDSHTVMLNELIGRLQEEALHARRTIGHLSRAVAALSGARADST